MELPAPPARLLGSFRNAVQVPPRRTATVLVGVIAKELTIHACCARVGPGEAESEGGFGRNLLSIQGGRLTNNTFLYKVLPTPVERQTTKEIGGNLVKKIRFSALLAILARGRYLQPKTDQIYCGYERAQN